MFIRGDMCDIRVSLNGVPYGDSWSEAEGGNLEAEIAKVRPGGMGNQKSAGGASARGDLTVRTPLSDVVATWVATFEALNGDGDMTVSFHWLGRNKQPLGTSLTRTGTLQQSNVPEVGDGSTVGMFEVVMSCDE